MDEDEILYQSIIADPERVDPDVDVSRFKTATPTSPALLADVAEYSGLQFDPTQTSYIADLYDLYSTGVPVIETPDTGTADTAQIPGAVDTLVDVGGEDQVTGGLTQGLTPTAPTETDTSMIGGDLDQGGQGDGITNYINTPAEALEQQQAIDQAISDLGDLYNPMTEVPADPATASAALSGSFFVPTTEAQQQAIDQGSQDQGLLGTISDAAREAFETVRSGASTAADFITTYGYPVYQALQGNLAAAGASIATGLTPLMLGANFAGKIFESVGDTKSKQEYDSYSPEQQSKIDKAYGPGGVMEGYNAVSQFGQGVSGTVQDRIDKLEEIVANPNRDISNVYTIDKDGNRIFNPSFNSAEKQLAKLQNLQDEAGLTKREEPVQLTLEEIFDRDDVDPADQGDTKSDTVGTNLQTITPDPPGVMFDDPFQSDDTGTTDIAVDPIDDFEVSGGVAPGGAQQVFDTAFGSPDSGGDDSDSDTDTSTGQSAGVMDDDPFAGESVNEFADVDAGTADEQSGSGGDSGGGKIVCTMMNKTYGFGSFRNKIWLKQSKDLAPEYQKGYHILFLPLVKIAETNKVVRKILEHIAVHRTIDIRQESRGKTHMLGRLYRKILEPICYWVGKNAKR
jgi:hypothetical protein